MRILVVEDEPALCSFLLPMLAGEGYTTSAVHTGADALAAINARPPDLVLLDVGLPDLSGLEVCRAIRRRGEYLPVVMLTGLDTPEDELRGFAAQADDYVMKPVVTERLLARIRAVLRLAGGSQASVVRLGAAEVDLRGKLVRRDGRPVSVGVKQFALLEFLLEHPGRVFGKTALLTQVWGPDTDATAHTVEERISNLREVIEVNPNRPRHLLNRRGLGYYLSVEGES